MTQKDIYDYVKTEEANFKTLPITVTEGWEFHFYEHVRVSTLYKNSQFSKGKDDNKPFKNIIRPILNLQYRAEGFDVKDINLFVDSAEGYYKSFLVRKFHEKWARENGIDTFIDEMVESFVDYGGALVKNVKGVRPEVVPLQSIAFCDQTDLLGGPICIKHFFSPDQLKDMEGHGWQNVDEVITLAEDQKPGKQVDTAHNKTPSKYIEVYELHGSFPKWWLDDAEPMENTGYSKQLHLLTFYQKEDGTQQGITIFKGPERKSIFKLILRDKIFGRALGLGGAEELFQPQVWTNYAEIRMKQLLDSASKTLFKSTDDAFAGRNKTDNLENGEILILAPNTDISQIDTSPKSMVLFEKAVDEWAAHAQQMGAANDSIMGVQPSSGTPAELQNLVTQESHSLHDYRRGKLATFTDELYRDWIIPHIAQEITNGSKFLAELDLDELQQVADSLVVCETNKLIVEKILNGEVVDDQAIEQYKQQVRDQFMKGGSKKFMEILKGELADAPLEVEVNIAGKQKNMQAMTDKLMAVMRQLMSAPQLLNDPRMAKIFNQILEASGLDPIDFYQKPQPQDNGPSNRVSEAISFKDLPPDGKVQMAAQAGIRISPPKPVAANQPNQLPQ